ncbi:hypothetical protein EMCRGX_G029404 [Ephydatia muelleri]
MVGRADAHIPSIPIIRKGTLKKKKIDIRVFSPSSSYSVFRSTFGTKGTNAWVMELNGSLRNGASPSPKPVTPTIDTHFVVAAIDFGTTYSGYAFSFTRDP